MASTVATAPDLRGEAESALRLARVDPARVIALVEPGPWAALSSDPETAAIGLLALGTARYARHELAAARDHLERAVEAARASGLAEWEAEGHASLAAVLVSTGDLTAALEHLGDSRDGVVKGAPAARRECQRALVLQRLGRSDEALEAYRRGMAAMRRAGDRAGEARVLVNRGLLHAYAGRFDAAFSELRRAGHLYRQLGLALEAAYADHNIGFVAARQGDIPTALGAYERAACALAQLGVPHPAALVDYCETLLRANLVREAGDVGRQAVEQMEAAGMETDLAEARLLLAEVALAADDLDLAEHLTVLAEFAFLAQDRRSWALMARYAWLRTRWARGDRSAETRAAAQTLATDLAGAGWQASAAHARIIAARTALERGEADVAAAELRAEARQRRRAPAAIRIQAWYAEALQRWEGGNARGAQSALRAGMRTFSRYRASLGATELRVNAGSHAYDLGRLAIQVALGRGDPARVLAWAERVRASTAQLSPVRPPADGELAGRLAKLRVLDQNLQAAALAGADSAGLRRDKALMEDAIRRQSWLAAGYRFEPPREPAAGELRAALGARVLLEFVESEGSLHAVALRRGRMRLFGLGAAGDIEREVDAVRFALNRLAARRGAPGWEEAMEQALTQAAGRLDALLFDPVRATIADEALVIVPTGALHLLPWAVLPSCRGRAVAVAPSAAAWLAAATAARGAVAGEPAVLAAGPSVHHSRGELDALAAIYPQATRLSGPAATARSVAAALDGAGLAHVIAHGTFRADNPLFSSLQLADGPLTVYDLERLSGAPRRVVLSACNAGLSSVRPGNELLGLASALLALGTQSLVASVLLVSDRDTSRLMVDLHRSLAAGADVPTALAGAQLRAGDDPRAVASASSFVCFGA